MMLFLNGFLISSTFTDMSVYIIMLYWV